MNVLKMMDLDLADKRVLIRQDLNVPVTDGRVTSRARIEASLQTIKAARDAGARVMLMSHLGRPVEGEYNTEYSLQPVAHCLTELLEQPVTVHKNWLDGVTVDAGQVALCENVRFNSGEKSNDEALSKRMAKLCDIFVMDAFGTAHRAQASTHGVGRFAPVACAGPLLVRELEALGHALENPKRPMYAIVGGSKVSTKLTVLDSLAERVDGLVVGGGIANTIIAAAGYNVGASLYEPDLIDEAKRLMKAVAARGGDIPVPVDVVVAKEFSANAQAQTKAVEDVESDDLILDIGPASARQLAEKMAGAGTIVWNGPVGVFEYDQFADGTRVLGQAVADSTAFSIAGGGDTLAAVDKFGLSEKISYISTGGGAFLEFLEGKELPAVAMLKARA